MSTYNTQPEIHITGVKETPQRGWPAVIAQLRRQLDQPNAVLCADLYPGVNEEEVLAQLQTLKPALVIRTRDLFVSEEEMNRRLQNVLTDDRVFGRMYYGEVMDFIDPVKLAQARKQVRMAAGLTVICGFAASLVSRGDLLVYFDLDRWEIQLRYRAGLSNFNCHNADEDILRKFKRGYFFEWRIADRHKASLLASLDAIVDTNRADDPVMVSGSMLREGLRQAAQQPFRLVPYFDPGVWGGQWMKEHCGLDPRQNNYAWSFDGVPEENALRLEFQGTALEIPAMDLVLYQPRQLLGEQVYARFGAEFPIRFDFLDTIHGQNLSLQVHPTTDYIHRMFGMAYTQDESYYILDAEPGACVYLGLKDGIDRQAMLQDLQDAQAGGKPFDADRYINRFPAAKHDHFLIPAGTIHCSGAGAMVLEISATPYIFTFKLWDWGRLGLDGRPRPINIEHGSHVIQWDRTTEWVRQNLVNASRVIHQDAAYMEEHTGLHELEFIETRRYWTASEVHIDPRGGVNMLNLVDGRQAVICSENGKFAPFTVHYAETFILPAAAGPYVIQSPDHSRIGVMRAYVRTPQAD